MFLWQTFVIINYQPINPLKSSPFSPPPPFFFERGLLCVGLAVLELAL